MVNGSGKITANHLRYYSIHGEDFRLF